ncbi:helix-turn-helix transcriptional regulator [Actinomadura sp. NPDC048955]|uniref:helix-turn-helix domain-containing protein n=1 Tax=Actinomadura sp. NPDC048955 TaxID=3158228 RepID=UPI0033F9E7F6
MKRQVSYQWRLREVMAAHGMFSATDLAGPLAERGIMLSSVQVWRLVTQSPERLSLPVLAALCDILNCTPSDLIATRAENAAPRRTATGETGTPAPQVAPIRPKRARIRPEQ